MQEGYLSIFIVELVSFSFSVVLLAAELRLLAPTIRNKITLFMITFLCSISFAYFFRFLGILLGNDDLRVFGATFSALVGGLAILFWATYLTNLDVIIQQLLTILIISGLLVFILGRLLLISSLTSIGLIITLLIFLYSVARVIRFIFSKTEYVRARQRAFLLITGFIGFALFDFLAVYLIGIGSIQKASVMFALEFPFRLLIYLSILLPISVTSFLNRFIH
ncbi:MAG: hypothetical protein INQ03_07265 [Candidatus Heimdallarchaeota archaeon]|nr:hypothetical protein [Candidatus Heimdallarchaeota archaeon]